MYGLEEIYESLLLEAKSPEEMKKILEYQFVQGRGVPQEVLDAIFDIDPTKKKSYTKWALMMWGGEKELLMASIKDGKLAKLFKYAQERAASGFNLASTRTLSEALDMLPDEDPIFAKDGDGPENDFEIVYDTPEWRIARPNTFEADKKLGRGCRWCTADAYGNGGTFWEKYSSYGPLWINYDLRTSETCPMDRKEYPYKRYQFLFEYGDRGELKDCHNNDFNYESSDMPDEVLEFYANIDESYKNKLLRSEKSKEERYEDYVDWRYSQGRTVAEYNGRYLSVMPEFTNDYEIDEDCDYYLYDEHDDCEEVCSNQMNPDKAIVDNFDYKYPFVILKDIYDTTLLAYYDSSRRYRPWDVKDFDDGGYKEFDGMVALWTDDGSIDIYQEYDDYSFFSDNLKCSRWGNSIEDIYIHPLKYANGMIAIEVIDDENYHYLIAASTDGDGEGNLIIGRDIPANGSKLFEIQMDDRGHYTFGQIHGKRYIELNDDNEEESEEIAHITEKLGDNLYIVDFGKDKSDGCNIYDLASKEYLIPMRVKSIQKEGDSKAVIQLLSSEWVVYDLINRRFIGEKIHSRPVRLSNGFYYSKTVYFFSVFDSDFNKIKEIEGTLIGTSGINLIFKDTNGFIKFFSTEDGIVFGEEGIGRYYNFLDDLMMMERNDGYLCIYNISERKIIANDCKLEKPYVYYDELFKYTTVNGKERMADKINGPITVEFDDITQIDGGVFEVERNGYKTYFYPYAEQGEKFWPSERGIPVENFFAGGYSGSLLMKDGKALARVNPYEKKVIFNTTLAPELAKEAEQILFPRAEAIAESFKKFYNRLTDK